MAATDIAVPLPVPRSSRVRRSGALLTLARRRAALTAHNPRQIAVPLLTPILFAPVIAILPWFFGGALFPIAALPTGLTAFAKVPPLTHALALMRYGLVDPRGTGLHDIWGMSSTTTEAWLSLGVVVAFAAALTALAIRVFGRSAVR